MIDSHVHFWNYHPVKDAWIDERMAILQRDFSPVDLFPEMQARGVEVCVAVQADQSENETDFLLAYAQNHPFVAAVVGWVGLGADNLESKLEKYAENKLLKGWRHILQAEADGFMSSITFKNGIAKLAAFNYTYDLLIYHTQLAECINLVNSFPNQRFVLDHIAKPPIKTGEGKEAWALQLKELAKHEGLYCKISGMVTEADWQNWQISDFDFYIDTVLEAFGTQRVLFGSDWPVCNLAANYKQVLSISQNYFKQFSANEQLAFFKNNAIDFYQI